MAVAIFSHPVVGQLTIENGIDEAQWAYNLNTQTFPTYGGEVVQILSVYIDDLTVGGSCSTYSQIEAIYSYFAHYLQVATQGTTGTVDRAAGTSYNLDPMTFTYAERNWSFSLYPKSVPGFGYGWDTVLCTWQVTAHIIDEHQQNQSLIDIKAAIKDSAVASQMDEFRSLKDQISPLTGDPSTDPFQTYTQGSLSAQAAIGSYADFYSSLVSGYQSGDFESLTGGNGSSPAKAKTNKRSNRTERARTGGTG